MSKKNNSVVIVSLQLCLPSDSRVRADITLSGAMSDSHPLAELLCKELSLSAATVMRGLGHEILRARKPHSAVDLASAPQTQIQDDL